MCVASCKMVPVVLANGVTVELPAYVAGLSFSAKWCIYVEFLRNMYEIPVGATPVSLWAGLGVSGRADLWYTLWDEEDLDFLCPVQQFEYFGKINHNAPHTVQRLPLTLGVARLTPCQFGALVKKHIDFLVWCAVTPI